MFDLNKIVRPNILSLKPYTSARDEFKGEKGVFFDANENPFGNLNRYPDPYQKALKQRLATLKGVAPSNIFIGNGSDEVIDLLFRIFCEPSKDKAITFTPTYGMYQVSAAINDVEMINIPLNDDFEIVTSRVTPYYEDPTIKLMFVCSPNNPTGNRFDKKNIETLLKNFKGIVVIDEAYIDFSETASWLGELDKYPNLIITQTFSKAWGLAAARVGVAYTSSAILGFLNKVKPPYNVSTLNQEAALAILKDNKEIEAQRKLILKERKKLTIALSKLALVQKIYPSDTNFILIKVKDAITLYTRLIAQKIIIRNRTKIIENCLRISIGTPKENEMLLSTLKELQDEKNTIYR